MGKARKVNKDTLRRLLQEEWTVNDCAEHFGSAASTISRHKKEIEHAEQSWNQRKERKERENKVTAETTPKLSGPYSVEQDVAILRTEGRYRELSALASAWGRPSASIIGRWHRLNAGG